MLLLLLLLLSIGLVLVLVEEQANLCQQPQLALLPVAAVCPLRWLTAAALGCSSIDGRNKAARRGFSGQMCVRVEMALQPGAHALCCCCALCCSCCQGMQQRCKGPSTATHGAANMMLASLHRLPPLRICWQSCCQCLLDTGSGSALGVSAHAGVISVAVNYLIRC